MSETKKENIVKATAKELGLTYRELGEAIGYTEGGLKNAVTQDKVSESMQKAIELFLENLKLKKEMQNTKAFKQLLKDFLKD